MYSKQSVIAFVVSMVIISIPLWLLQNYEGGSFAWYYMAVIALGYILVNNKGIAASLKFFQSQK